MVVTVSLTHYTAIDLRLRLSFKCIHRTLSSDVNLLCFPVFHGEPDVQVELSVVPDRLVVRDDVEEHRRRPRRRRVDPDGVEHVPDAAA